MIMCGATWPNQRVHDAFPEVPDLCTRCGRSVDTALHMFWNCPANTNIDSESVQKTQYLIQAAVAKSEDEPGLWLRGLLPAHYTEIESQYCPPDIVKPISTNPESIDWKSQNMMTGVFYGDASGGIFSSMPRIRRIGCGLVQVDGDDDLIWAHHFNLPGPFQTVPHSRRYVLLCLVRRLEPGADVTYAADNQKVRDVLVQGEAAASKSTKCDLFKEVFKLIHQHNLKISVKWMPSHLGHDDPPATRWGVGVGCER